MKSQVLLAIIILIIISCDSKTKQASTTSNNTDITQNNPIIQLPPDLKYSIANSETNKTDESINITVELNQKLSNDQLRLLSNTIKKIQTYSKVHIKYTLSQNPTSTWAKVEYFPSFKMEIVDLTPEKKESSKNDNTPNIKKIENGKIIFYGDTCYILVNQPSFTRILTSRIIEEKHFKEIAKVLGVKTELVYFHTSGYTDTGEEYGFMSPNFTTSYKQIKQEKTPIYSTVKPKRIEGDIARRAFITSQDFVKRKLLSPKSADFSSGYVVEDYGNNIYTVLSYVDAKNATGVEIRTHFKLKLKWNGNEWTDINNWQLLDSKYE